jgi:hypothetical protein
VNQRTKDVYVIPSIITLGGGLLLIPVTAWLTNVPMRTVFTYIGVKNLWFAPVPAWVPFVSVFCLVIALVISIRYGKDKHRRVSALESAADAMQRNHTNELQASRRPPAQMDVLWTPGTCWCGEDVVNGQDATYLRGMAHVSLRNVHVDITLVQAQVNGNEPAEFGPLFIRNGIAAEIELFIDTVPSLGDRSEPLRATITFIDNRSRRYTIPEKTFEWNPIVPVEGEIQPVGRPEYPIPGRNWWE